ncbi:hypothetical protein [Geoalkalibacter halelectricus]|uniref:hypothetical protein n=1 Tax=Geoalkalibacter halelectricus TaxID=2847045 RepID=UPI003D251440
MRRLAWPLILLLPLLAGIHFFAHEQAWEQRREYRRTLDAGYVLPSRFIRVFALEHKGVMANYLLLKTMNFYGDRVMHQEQLSEEDWHYIVSSLDAVTDLDPRFLDPYIFGVTLLTWEAGMIEEANRLLEKGMEHRSHDWQMPFFLGFNHFYFLQDFATGAEYLMQASRLPESPNFLPNLAARLSYYGQRTGSAIVFLQTLLLQTADEGLRASLERRLLALQRADLIEQAVARFKDEQGRLPEKAQELLEGGYLEEMPEDPYGGQWVLLPGGRVFSTSRFVVEPAPDLPQDLE